MVVISTSSISEFVFLGASTMATVRLNGIKLSYDVQGSPEHEPLLLIAGFNSDISSWSALMPLLIKQYRVIRFDNRGIGQSSAPDAPYSIQQLAADAIALLDYLEIPQAHVVGHSMGGQIAQELVLAYPTRVQSLILLSSWAIGDNKFHSLIELFGTLAVQLNRVQYAKVLLPWMFSTAFYSIPGAIEQIISMVEKSPFPPAPNVLYHQSRAILNSDTSNRIATIQVPTLVVVAKEDLVTPVRFSQHLAQSIPNAELVVLEQGGHAFIIEIAEAVANVILNFLTVRKI